MLKDKVIKGAIIGLLADAIKLSVNYIFFRLNYTQNIFWQLVATRFVDKNHLSSSLSYVIGGTADAIVSATLGVVFLYSLKFIGNDYLWVKGMGFGLVIWVSLFGTLLGQSVQDKLPQEPLAIIVTITAHLFFGLSLALFTKILTKKKIRR